MRLSITYHMHWAQVPLSKNMHEIHVLLLSHGSEFFFQTAQSLPPAAKRSSMLVSMRGPSGPFEGCRFFFGRMRLRGSRFLDLSEARSRLYGGRFLQLKFRLIFQHFSFFNILKHNSQDYQIIIYGLFQIFASFQDFRTFSLLQISAQIRRISRNSRTYFASL